MRIFTQTLSAKDKSRNLFLIVACHLILCREKISLTVLTAQNGKVDDPFQDAVRAPLKDHWRQKTVRASHQVRRIVKALMWRALT